MPIQWYYAKGNRQLGPVSSTELKQLSESGDLAEGDLVWREGMEEWIAAKKVKGLFAVDEPEPSASPPVEAPPVQEPTAAKTVSGVGSLPAGVAGTPRGTLRHPLDMFLDFCRRQFTSRFVDSTSTMFSVVGHYGLYGAMLLLVVFCLVVGIKVEVETLPMTLGFGLVGVVILFVLQYASRRFLEALEKLNRSTPTRMSSTALLDCFALLFMFAGVASLVALVMMALPTEHQGETGQLSLILPAIGSFVLWQYAAILSLNPRSLCITVAPEASGGEEAIGLVAFLMKLILRTVPVAFGVGIVLGSFDLLVNCVQVSQLSELDDVAARMAALPIILSVVGVAAVLPIVGYFLSLSAYLFIDVVRSILELPRALAGEEAKKES